MVWTSDDTDGDLHAIAIRALLAVGAVVFFLEIVSLASPHYGWFIDEFYYFACTKRIDWGYVDHPPFSIFVLRGIRALFGDSLLAARSFAALCGASTVVLGGLMAQRMGAGRYGQTLAAIGIACSPLMLAIFGFYSMNAIEVLLWTMACLVLVEILARDEPTLFWVLGAIVGFGVMNKHTTALFVAGLAIGVIATRSRTMLLRGAFWGGVAVALVIVLPNLWWQVEHDWVSVEFYRSAAGKNAATSPIGALMSQLEALNPGSLPIWAAGAFLLLRDRRWRPLGILFAVLFLGLVFSGQSRQDRIAGLVPLVFASGAVFWERAAGRRARVALASAPIVVALVLSPIVLPILPPAQLSRYAAALGVVTELEAHETPLALPQWFADRVEWDVFVRAIEDAYASLPAEDAASAIILTESYAGAGAIEMLGHDLPPVYALHNSYHSWGPPGPFEVAIAVQFTREELARYFGSVEQVGEFQCTWCRQFRRPQPIFAVREPLQPIESAWSELAVYR